MSEHDPAAPAAPEAPAAPVAAPEGGISAGQIPVNTPQRVFAPCPCGKVPDKLLLEVNQQDKVGRAVCPCGQWGIDFLRGVEVEPEKILDRAAAAWDAAPRAS